MGLELTLPLFLSTLLVSLIPWLIVILVSGGLGYPFAILLRRWFQSHPWGLNYLVLLPWRSVAAWIALVVIQTPLIIWQFGLGQISTGIAVGIALSVLILPWMTSTIIRSWYPLSLLPKVLSIFRMSAILSIVLSVLLYAGVGYFLYHASWNSDFHKMITAYQVVGALLLGLDLLFGLIQFGLSYPRPGLNVKAT